MIYYGIEIATGAVIKNLNCEKGSTLPTTNLQQGRLFYHSVENALYAHNGTAWVVASGGGGGASGVTSFNNRTGAITFNSSDLPIASSSSVGGVKVGSGLTIDGTGVLSAIGGSGGGTAGVLSFNGRTGYVTFGATDLPVASAGSLGGVKVGSGLAIDGSGVLSATVVGGGTGGATSFPTGTRLLFAQASAPVGWTQVTGPESNNRMLRVVDTGGGATGGSDDPTIMNVVPAHTHTYNGSTDVTPDHQHQERIGQIAGSTGQTTGGTNMTGTYPHYNNIGLTAPGGTHSHTVSGTTATNGSSANWAPKYLSLILCSKA